MQLKLGTMYLSVGVLYILMVLAIPMLFYVGFMSSDDGFYARRASVLISDAAFVLPESHWAFRYPVVYPLAVILHFFGWSESTSLILPAIYFLVTVALLGWVCARYFGQRASLVFGFLTLSSPMLVVEATIINVDIPEALFLILSVLLMYSAIGKESDTARNRLLLSGVLCGVAIMTRETAYGLLLVYGLLFLRGAYFPRLQYLWGGLGVLIVLLVEWGSYMAYGESPLYRLTTMLHSHGSLIQSGNFTAGTGNISDNWLLGPILALLVNQEFGLLFYVVPIAVFGLLRSPKLSGPQRQFIEIFGFSALVWFLWIGYSGAVRSLPRYYIFDQLIALILVSMWLAIVVPARWRATIVIVLLSSNYALLCVENTHPRFAERTIKTYAVTVGVKIATDPLTERWADGYFHLDGYDSKNYLNTEPVLAEGSLYAFIAGRAKDDRRLDPAQLAMMQKGAVPPVWRKDPPVLPVGRILSFVGADALLPGEFYAKLAFRNQPVVIYRLKAAPS